MVNHSVIYSHNKITNYGKDDHSAKKVCSSNNQKYVQICAFDALNQLEFSES